ncbi:MULTISPECIES: DEAD/DEAH box helicase [Cloacibacillus]|uniref:DEAD/DEAH box helicase n=1 Tax=Cloacibacillus TaxID=508459 RepID=UPI0023F08F1D|nr:MULTISPECIES: DEAD/DEAH box helicase [Cloacibacillus]MCC8184992.1 DEAD/DEAH box helicase [Cloacibacillus porcorum]
MITLRDYQVTMLQEVAAEFAAGSRAVCLVGPCGCGKTVMVGWSSAMSAGQGRRVLFLVHRQELIDQSSETFTALGISHGIIAAGQPRRYERLVQIGSVQTVAKRLHEIPAPDYIITDECHHSVAATYRKIVDAYKDAYCLGVTATPERLGGQGLGDIFQRLVIGPSVKELIGCGNLAPYDLYAPPSKVDTSDIRVKFGDYVRDDLVAAVDKSDIIGGLVENYRKLADGTNAVCYCVSRAHSDHVAQIFRDAGISATHIDGDTDRHLRAQIISDFRARRVKVLCNVDLISEGFDVPSMETVILARPTQSLGLYIQQSMRPMRPDRGKPDKRAIIIDHVGNVFRHGMPDEDREWTLESKKRAKRTIGVQLRTCPKCLRVHSPGPKCPFCGYEYPRAVEEAIPRQLDGELSKVEELEILAKKNKRMEVGRARTIRDLEMIAIKRGYAFGWVRHMAQIKGIRYERA